MKHITAHELLSTWKLTVTRLRFLHICQQMKGYSFLPPAVLLHEMLHFLCSSHPSDNISTPRYVCMRSSTSMRTYMQIFSCFLVSDCGKMEHGLHFTLCMIPEFNWTVVLFFLHTIKLSCIHHAVCVLCVPSVFYEPALDSENIKMPG